MGITTLSVQEAMNVSLGGLGFKVCSNNTISPDNNMVFTILVSDTNTTYSAITESGDNLPLQSRLAGSVRFGRFLSVTENSGGTILAYQAPR